ncbi:hypothetical protein, partial [Chelonobacter oris]|uniref:hypothetical protein n=1 Tax=Chelonobacter oris TaxID=505317 RepID=UPI00244A4B9D
MDVENDGIVEVHKAPFPRHLQADKPLKENITLDSVSTQDDFAEDGEALDKLNAENDVVLDSAYSGKWVLNLFLFDKDGNEIKDEDSYDEEEEKPVYTTINGNNVHIDNANKVI